MFHIGYIYFLLHESPQSIDCIYAVIYGSRGSAAALSLQQIPPKVKLWAEIRQNLTQQ